MSQGQLVHREIPLHPALPEKMRQRLAGSPVSFTLPKPVRMRLRQPEKLKISECAAKYRVVTGIDARPGPWRNDLMPHTVFAMDVWQKPWVKEVWLCWPERAGKTNVMLNCLAGVAKMSPGNVFWLEPADDDAGNNVKTKIIPMFRESPGLRRYLSPRADDTGKKLIAFSHGMHLFPASANSARTMANFFGKYNFGNEVDKYPPMVGSETDPIKLIRKRGRDVRGSKFMFGSTPAGRYIYKGTMACRQVRQYHNRCPHCNELVLMDDEHLSIPPDATPDQVENGDVPVGYACNACGVEWDEYDRESSYTRGAWHCIKGSEDSKPATVGLHASALPFPMVSLSEYCGKYLRSKSGDLADKVDYAHGYQVKDYEVDKVDRKEDSLLRLIDYSMPRGVVPRDTNSVLIVADTQKRGFYYEVRAVGWGRELGNRIIDHGFVERKEHLNLLADREWVDADGVRYRARKGFIDSGGGADPNHPKHSRTREVYDFCIDNPFWSPLKGRQRQATPVSWTRLDFYPTSDGRKVAIPGGLILYTIDTTYYKNTLSMKLLIDPGNPGACQLHAGLTKEEMEGWRGSHSAQHEGQLRWQPYAKQMCAETQDHRGYWVNPNNAPNHHWDLGGYFYAGCDILYIGDEQRPEEQPPQAEPQTKKTVMKSKSRRW